MRSEQEAIRAIDLYSDMIKRICFLYLKNDADTDDIFQNVFLKYIIYSGTFKNDEHEKAWIARVTINKCKDMLKSFFRKRVVSLEEAWADKTVNIPEHNELLDAVLSLQEKYKVVIYLFYYENYKAVEIAKILNKSENTVYTLLSRGRKILRDKLRGEYFGG